MEPINLTIATGGKSAVEVSLRQAKTIKENKKSITVNGHNYYLKAKGSSESLALFHAKLERLPHLEFASNEDLKNFFEKDILPSGTVEKTQKTAILLSAQPKEIEIAKKQGEIVEKILACSGSRQEIKACIAKHKQDLKFLRPIAISLVQQGAIVKANQFVKLLPLVEGSDYDSCYLEVAKASFAYGKEHGDALALNYAYHLLANIKYQDPPLSPEEAIVSEVEVSIKAIQETLQQIGSNAALNTLECIEIRELLGRGAYKTVKNEEDKDLNEEDLKKILDKENKENPQFTEAFDKANRLQQKIDQDHSPAAPGELIPIEVDGHSISLHVQISGSRKSGEPLIILEAGNGCFSADWQKVQQALPKNMQVMSYDRAGMGWSSASPQPPTIQNSLANLEKLLKTPGLEPPYIFVGHSYGGFMGQLFAMRHDRPEDIHGLILVDSAIEGHLPGGESPKSTLASYLPTAAKNGFFENDRVQYLEAQNSFLVDQITAKTTHEKTDLSEKALFAQSAAFLTNTLEEKKEQGSNPPISCPMVVLTALKDNMEGNKVKDQAKRDNFLNRQDELKERASSCKQKKIADSDHFINYFRSDAICKSILDLR